MTFNRDTFIDMLIEFIGNESLFNPFNDICALHDAPSAYRIRQDNLHQVLRRLNNFDSILFGEAGGYLGYRRTGIAFTDELSYPIVERIWGASNLMRATKSGKNKERSATVLWSILQDLEIPPFMWNILPFHPHKKENPMSNRTPILSEITQAEAITRYLIDKGGFDKIYGVGKKASQSLEKMGYDVIPMRHPSYGGMNIFKEEMKYYFKKREKPQERGLFDFF